MSELPGDEALSAESLTFSTLSTTAAIRLQQPIALNILVSPIHG